MAEARALRAEKQVERLERELELIKSHIKRPNGTANGGTANSASSSPTLAHRGLEADKVNFQLSEQVKDLKYQLKHQSYEYTKLQETSQSKTNEYEEKLKRMREIFGQASKNIDGYRASIASKDTEIERLKVELEECQVREQSYKSTSESQQLSIEKLNTEITSQKTFYGSEIKQLEAKSRQLSTQLEQTKNNYDQYKKRAHVLLEKNKEQKSDVTRITELEELVQQLTSQKTKYELEQAEKAEHQLLLEHDLRKAIDRIHELEASQNIMIKEKDKKEKMVDDLKQAAINDKKSLETKLTNITQSYNTTNQQLEELKSKYNTLLSSANTSPEPNKQQKDEDNASTITNEDDITQKYVDLKFKLHELQETNEHLLVLLQQKDNEIEKLIVSTPTSPPPSSEEHDDGIQSLSPKEEDSKSIYSGNDVYASMSSLLSPLVSRQVQPADERIGLEKQVQRLSEMLRDSEEKVSALRNQEKILKDELRKIDAVEKRQDMNVEYLKNVLVKFLMSENKQAMVPILAKLLYLDKAETNHLMESCM